MTVSRRNIADEAQSNKWKHFFKFALNKKVPLKLLQCFFQTNIRNIAAEMLKYAILNRSGLQTG